MVQKYPEIQVVSRDRGGIYAMATRDGAPQATQMADRWHLLKNIGDALEYMMYRHMPLIRRVATELSPKKTDTQAPATMPAKLRLPDRIKQQRRDKRHQRWTEVDSLHKKGCRIKEISRVTGLSRVTVRRWIQSKVFPEISTKPPRSGLLAPGHLPSASRVSRWLMLKGEENYASRFIESMCQKEPHLKVAQQLSLDFYRRVMSPLAKGIIEAC